MYYNICIAGLNRDSKQQFSQWLEKMEGLQLNVIPCPFSKKPIHIQIVEIDHWHDWVRLARLKQHFNCYYIVILQEHLIRTAPLAIKLGVQELLITPVKKSAFYRAIQEVMTVFGREEISLHGSEENITITIQKTADSANDTLEQYVLRKFLHGDLENKEEMMEALSLFHANDFPNVACFVQGFIYPGHEDILLNEAIRAIYASFERAFRNLVPKLHFLRASRSLIVLFRRMDAIVPMSRWQEGRQQFEWIVDEMLHEHGIQLYIGVGSQYSEPEELQHSFQEAQIARNMPPYSEISLRYFDEISTEPDVVKTMELIEASFAKPLSAKEAARHVNLSYSHFVRLFKKETGNTFSEYLTFIRLRQAVWLLRHSNKTIDEISDMTGFNTPNYFSATFKKVVGLTPSDFRSTRYILFS